MGVVKGVNGNISFAGVTVKIAAFEINTGQSLFNVSAFGGGNWVDREGGGLKDLTGTATGFIVKGGSNCNPFTYVDEIGPATFTFDSGCSLATNILVGAVRTGLTHEGVGVCSIEFAKADTTDPVITWNEAGDTNLGG